MILARRFPMGRWGVLRTSSTTLWYPVQLSATTDSDECRLRLGSCSVKPTVMETFVRCLVKQDTPSGDLGAGDVARMGALMPWAEHK